MDISVCVIENSVGLVQNSVRRYGKGVSWMDCLVEHFIVYQEVVFKVIYGQEVSDKK